MFSLAVGVSKREIGPKSRILEQSETWPILVAPFSYSIGIENLIYIIIFCYGSSNEHINISSSAPD